MTRLKAIGPDAWQLMAEPLRLPGGVRMPIASTVFRLADRSLVIYSPVPIDDEVAAELAGIGEVAHIVAPSLWHHLHARAAHERYPRATLHGAPGLAAKTGLAVQRELGAVDPSWGDALDIVVIGGAPKLNEAVLFHRPSGTLAVADLVFNMKKPEGVMTKLLFAMTGVGGGTLAQSRVWKLAVKDRAAARASLDRVLAWPLQHVSPAHGDVIDIDASTLAPVLAKAYGAEPQLGRAV